VQRQEKYSRRYEQIRNALRLKARESGEGKRVFWECIDTLKHKVREAPKVEIENVRNYLLATIAKAISFGHSVADITREFWQDVGEYGTRTRQIYRDLLGLEDDVRDQLNND